MYTVCYNVQATSFKFFFRRIQSTIPRFPIGLDERIFTRAVRYLAELGYRGPLALSCDDTKLHAALRLCWDAEAQCDVLVGGVGEPRRVTNTEELKEVLRELEGQKASKVDATTSKSSIFSETTYVYFSVASMVPSNRWCSKAPTHHSCRQSYSR